MRSIILGLVGALVFFISACADRSALDIEYRLYKSDIPEGRRIAYTEPREPCNYYNTLRSPHFGDLHVHTARSLDANIQDTRTTPEQAYHFAQGQAIGIAPWVDKNTPSRTLQIGRPLDFAMVSDHAEFFGELNICTNPLHDQYTSFRCKRYRNNPQSTFTAWNFQYLADRPKDRALSRFLFCGSAGARCLDAAIPVWQEMQTAANAAYDKSSDCNFTAFIGYEHTGSPGSKNLHRNVIFKNNNVPTEPLSYLEYSKPENLWNGLSSICHQETNCESLTIPHNSNVSGGRMFKRDRDDLSDFDKNYVALRNAYEPLVEIYQHKGGSECKRSADELCNFEKFPFNNLIADRFGGLLSKEPKQDNFIRYALKNGMKQERLNGINPFKYGFVGGTDTHLGAPGATSEVNFPGHGGAGSSEAGNGLNDSIAFSGGGLTVVWAEENSREYLFDAMQRKETYATSGPRMLVRMFAGWNYDATMCDSVVYSDSGHALINSDFVKKGYSHGVPMGADLAGSAGNGAPYIAVAALKDPGFFTHDKSHPLYEPSIGIQRIQIVKAWVDANNKTHEKVFDVAGAANGASVDLNTCEVTQPKPKGQALCNVWQDPTFNAANNAVYYARVVENPSCRWSWRQCNAYIKTSRWNNVEDACQHVDKLPEGYQHCCLHEHVAKTSKNTFEKKQMGTYPATVQERAWTSPIWYNAP